MYTVVKNNNYYIVAHEGVYYNCKTVFDLAKKLKQLGLTK